MAKARTSSSNSTSSPKTPPTEAPYDPNEARRTAQALIARYGTVDATRRAAYESIVTNAQKAESGARTRASGVVADAIVYAVVIDKTFASYPAAVGEHYAPQRFSYYLDCVAALIEATEAQKSQRGGTDASRTTAQEREDAARVGRAKLSRKLERVAARESDLDAVDRARGTTESATELGTSILESATLARAWMARTDATSKVLCEDAGLTEAFVAQVVALGEALTGAASDATLAGRKRSADAPEVNLLEGSVLHEMLEAQRSFEEAHQENPVVPRLVPGPATRNVIGSRKHKAAEKPAATSAPTP